MCNQLDNVPLASLPSVQEINQRIKDLRAEVTELTALKRVVETRAKNDANRLRIAEQNGVKP